VQDSQQSAGPLAEGSWATKTNVAVDAGPSYTHGSSSLPGRHGEALVLDADEDSDEIEIIQEAAPKRSFETGLRRTAAANGQEAPQVDTPARPSPVPAKPLSKQQMEEAAKLAERRKRFDNQRYQREQHEQREAAGHPVAAQQNIKQFHTPNDTPSFGSQSPQRKMNSSPAPMPDMTLGLSLTGAGSRDLGMQGGFLPGGVPGGIVDEGERVQAFVGKKTRKNHDDVESTGFDADDERLMKEILENCNDM